MCLTVRRDKALDFSRCPSCHETGVGHVRISSLAEIFVKFRTSSTRLRPVSWLCASQQLLFAGRKRLPDFNGLCLWLATFSIGQPALRYLPDGRVIQCQL